MNKRGQVSWLFIPIAMALIGFSLFSFVSFNDKFAGDSEGRDEMLVNIDFYEKHAVSESLIIAKSAIVSGGLIMTDAGLKARFQEIAEKKNLGIIGTKDYFDKIKNGEFDFKHNGREYLLEIKNLSLKAEKGANNFYRNLNFKIEFDFSGNVLNINSAKDL